MTRAGVYRESAGKEAKEMKEIRETREGGESYLILRRVRIPEKNGKGYGKLTDLLLFRPGEARAMPGRRRGTPGGTPYSADRAEDLPGKRGKRQLVLA